MSNESPPPDGLAPIESSAEGLAELGKRFTGRAGAVLRPLRTGPPSVSRDAAEVYAVEQIVLKVHWPGTDPGALAARMRLACDPLLHGVLLAPLHPEPLPLAGRWVTVWPLARTLPTGGGPLDVPWPAAAQLLAELHNHRVPRPEDLPECSQRERIERAVTDLVRTVRESEDGVPTGQVGTVLAAWDRIRREPPGPFRALCHGDWHFGQMVQHLRPPPDPPCSQNPQRSQNPQGPQNPQSWRLIDIDDLGWGDPTWDLGRAAAFHVLGVVPEQSWHLLTRTYREAGGPALPDDDLWRHLEQGARAHVVHCAARALTRHTLVGSQPDDLDRELLRACERMLID
ncbi:MAG: hypothetical protein QG608_275 [Actinomycetota bacterium]|nr:hypothetical protein [Actinomycetota bacterium]